MVRIKYATEQEHNEVLEIMSQNLNKQDNPRVGIFWYDIREDELFGVVSAYPEEIRNISNGMKTIERLHRDHWKKEFHKQKFKGKPGPFVGDYKDTPGRVWYDLKKKRQICCNYWFMDKEMATC